MAFPRVRLIRQAPERYMVYYETIYTSDKEITQHVPDDWEIACVDMCFSLERNYLWCHLHSSVDCECVFEVNRYRDGAGLKRNRD